MKRCLCLFPFVDEPSVGIERIGQILSATNLWHHVLREVVTAIGHRQPLSGAAYPTGSRRIARDI